MPGHQCYRKTRLFATVNVVRIATSSFKGKKTCGKSNIFAGCTHKKITVKFLLTFDHYSVLVSLQIIIAWCSFSGPNKIMKPIEPSLIDLETLFLLRSR